METDDGFEGKSLLTFLFHLSGKGRVQNPWGLPFSKVHSHHQSDEALRQQCKSPIFMYIDPSNQTPCNAFGRWDLIVTFTKVFKRQGTACLTSQRHSLCILGMNLRKHYNVLLHCNKHLDQTFCLTKSRCIDTVPTSSSTDTVT